MFKKIGNWLGNAGAQVWNWSGKALDFAFDMPGKAAEFAKTLSEKTQKGLGKTITETRKTERSQSEFLAEYLAKPSNLLIGGLVLIVIILLMRK